MKQKLKKIISIVLIICMTVTIFPAEGFVDASTSDNEISDTSENESEAVLEASQDMEEYLRENNEGEDLYRLVVDADDNVSNIEDILDDTAGVTDYILTEDECVIEFETQEDLDVAKDNLDNTDGDTNYWEDKIVSGALCDDTSWGIDLTGLSVAKSAYEATYDCDEVITVAVIDSGINDSNSVFSGRISGDSITYDGETLTDSLGHGTAVSYVIADNTPSNVELLIIDAFDEEGTSTIYTLKCALAYAIECGADIINMSWGIDLSEDSDDDRGENSEDLLDDLIEEANNAGIIMVAAAGNESTDVTYTYPANNSDVITVSSINSSLELSSFSNYGSTVDFCAPGQRIYTLYGSSMSYMSGTSFSAPYVSAAAAYMLLLDMPVYDTLKEYAVDINDEGWDEETGYGYIDLSELISYDEETTEKVSTEETTEETTEKVSTEETAEVATKDATENQDEDYEDPENPANITTKATLYTGPTSYSACSHASKYSSYTVLKGIDVSKWQGTIDWDAVADSGVEFAIIRVGYRGTETGELVLDSAAETNIKGAIEAGIQVGLYFFTQATTVAEAEEEANYVIDFLNDINIDSSNITLPIAMDFEYADGDTGRLYDAGLTKTQATNVCLAFCKKIESNGYSSMVYSSKSIFEDDLNASTISASYNIWLAHYTTSTSYSGDYAFWQFSSSGSVDGISGNVDLDFWYYTDELATPVLDSSTIAASGGIKVSWGKVSGASGYTVYRKTSGGSWTIIGNTTSTSYTDTTASAGTTYYYTVRAYTGSLSTANGNKYDSKYWSSYDKTGVTGKYIKMPVIKSTSAESSGTKLSWDKVSGATGYVIWRKTSSTSWSRVGTTTSTSFIDTSSRTSGTTYYYTIRAYYGNIDTANSNTFNSNYWSYYDTTGTKIVYLSKPTLSSTTAASGGIKVSWGKVNGASGYTVYRKKSGEKWSIIGNTTSTSYTDTTASAGTTYYYTVRAYAGSLSTANGNKYNAAYWSGYDSTGVTGKYIKKPSIKWASAESSGTKLTWNAVSGATGYVIWRKTSSTSWSRVGTTTGTSFTDTSSRTSGTTYYYTIRAYYGNIDTANSNTFNSNYWSYYDTTGTKIVYLSKPTLSSTIAANGGIKVNWGKVNGASGYTVYRKKSGEKWTIIGNTTSTSYTDMTASAGTTYYYTVRAYTGSLSTANGNKYNAAYWSGYDSTGVTGKYIKKPSIKWASAESSGTKLTWNAVSGATGYVIWRKTSSTSWSRVGTTTGTSFTDTSSRTSGTTYYYTIRAYSGNISTANSNTFNSNYWSYYDTAGTKTVYLSNPTLSSAKATSGGVKVSWGKVSGASGYVVYRKTSGGSWTIIGNTTSTSYTDTTASTGTTYYYTVRAYTGTYATVSKYKYNALYWSGYDSTGIKY